MKSQIIKIADLLYYPDLGYCRQESPSPFVYDAEYFNKYCEYSQTELGQQITAARVSLVNRYTTGEIIDIGIGCGQFVELRGNAKGYDVCPESIDWLTERGLFVNPYSTEITQSAICFWDSLEHITEPKELLGRVPSGCFVFVSLPVFEDLTKVTASKHHRPNEHIHYWTWQGLIEYFEGISFTCLELSNQESELGREDILTFVFKRD